MTDLFFFFFSNCQSYFYHRKASHPLSQASNLVGMGEGLLSVFLAQGLGEASAWKSDKQGGTGLGFPCPHFPEAHPIPLLFWQDGNKKYFSRRSQIA